MARGRIVIIVGKSPELDLALDAMEELDLPVRVIPTLAEAERLLLGAERPRVSAVLLGLGQDPPRALSLVRSIRERRNLAGIPVAVWAPGVEARVLPEAYAAGATSAVLLDGSSEDPIRLARMVHYWASANHPPLEEASA